MDLSVWSRDATFKDNLFGSTSDYVKSFETKYNIVPDYTTAACSATGEAFAAALQKIDAAPPLTTKQRRQLMKALENINIKTFYGAINFAKSGRHFHDNVSLKPLTVQNIGKTLYIVGPEQFIQHKLVYPRPSYKG